jgi:hypothetical protein
MLSEREILRAALVMVARHGRQARNRAEFRADALHQAGELRAALTWRMVMRRIDELATGRDGGAAPRASGTG